MENPYKHVFQQQLSPLTPAQSALQTTLISLLREKELSAISTVELCSKAFVARSTFYAYYQSIGEILEDVEDRLIYELLHIDEHDSEKSVDAQELALFYSRTFDIVAKNREAFYAMLVVNPNHRFIEKWKCGIKYLFWSRLFHGSEDSNSDLILEIGSSVVVTAFSYWMKHPHDVSPESIHAVISQLLRLIGYECQKKAEQQ